MMDACGQIDVLALLLVVLLLAVAAAIRRSAPRACPRCGAMDRRPCRHCARCGAPRCGSPRGGGDESVAEVAKAIAPASPKVAFDPKSPASRLRIGWCQRAAARDFRGRAVFPRESIAVSWSLPGAIVASIDSGTPEWTAYLRRISQVLGAPCVSVRWLVEWNDDPSRTQADVVAAAAAAEDMGCCRPAPQFP